MAGLVVVCPLEFEMRALRREIGRSVRFVVSGPGARAGEAVGRILSADRPAAIVLAGVCGGLRATDACPSVREVVDEGAGRWVPTLGARGEDGPGVVVVGVAAPVCGRDEKRRLRERTGADLVDCESHHFGGACEAAGVAWAVLRAVSDGPEDELPRVCAGLVDERGRLRRAQLARSIGARPSLIGELAALNRRSRVGLGLVAERVREIAGEVGRGALAAEPAR